MYEYAPVFAKKKEKMLTVLALVAGLAVYFVSYIPNIGYGVLFQLVGICGIAVMILLFSLVISRRYVYTVAPNHDGNMDFVITECYGRRRTVVCRVSVTSVQMAFPRTAEKREFLDAKKSGWRVYNYTGVLFDEQRYYLKIDECGERFLIQICANSDLISALVNH